MHRSAAAPTRRSVLAGAAGVLLAPALGTCTGSEDRPAVDADIVSADRAALRERRLIAAYDAALLIAPQLADRLVPLRDGHVAHLGALGLPDTPDTSAAPADDASAAPTRAPEPAPPLPSDPAALLAALAELERRAAAAHGNAAVLSGRGVGAVLATLAAAEASHAEALA
jgi:hypothetical protein